MDVGLQKGHEESPEKLKIQNHPHGVVADTLISSLKNIGFPLLDFSHVPMVCGGIKLLNMDIKMDQV